MIKRLRRRLASFLYAVAKEEPDEYYRRQIRRVAGRMVPDRWTQEEVDRLAHSAGIERRIAPHMARRGFVTHGLDQGISIRDMQIVARHEDPRTTARYDRGAQNLDGSAIHKLSASLAGGM